MDGHVQLINLLMPLTDDSKFDGGKLKLYDKPSN